MLTSRSNREFEFGFNSGERFVTNAKILKLALQYEVPKYLGVTKMYFLLRWKCEIPNGHACRDWNH